MDVDIIRSNKEKNRRRFLREHEKIRIIPLMEEEGRRAKAVAAVADGGVLDNSLEQNIGNKFENSK